MKESEPISKKKKQFKASYLLDDALFILDYSLSPGVWQSFVTIRSCNHLMRIISTYVDNTKKSEISWRWQLFKLGDNQLWSV